MSRSLRPQVTWVASPPPRVSPHPPRRHGRAPYHGPPAYPAPPRWGFPQLIWRWPTSVPGAGEPVTSTAARVRAASFGARALLTVTAIVAAVAVGAEIWRYVLLVRSRDEVLAAATVLASDVLTATAGVLAVVFALAAALLCLVWLHRARVAGGEVSSRRPARPDWQVLLGLLIPGLNLFVPFSVVAELEHAALHRDPDRRPKPSRLLWYWWAAWIVGALLWLATLLWNQRGGVQAMADDVVLHAVLDASAVAVSVLTLLVVRQLTLLLAPSPVSTGSFTHVVRVSGAPEPPPRPRPADAAR